VRLQGNALAVAAHTSAAGSSNNIVVSVDSITKPGSTTERRTDTEEAVEPLRLYRFEGHQLVAASTFEMAGADDEGTSVKPMNFLYNLDNLRKRDGEAKELD
jgi:tRNA (guanine-N(7)-)-methyltransferase subunit TRM82